MFSKLNKTFFKKEKKLNKTLICGIYSHNLYLSTQLEIIYIFNLFGFTFIDYGCLIRVVTTNNEIIRKLYKKTKYVWINVAILFYSIIYANIY
jgi:hypothetical protein